MRFDVMKKFVFIAGMPRSGSTLLCNLLNQNPRFRATGTSAVCDLMLGVNAAWGQSPEAKATATTQDKLNTLRGMLEGYHAGIEQPVVFSKSRGWVAAAELLRQVLGERPVILVTYRDIPSILSSCEKLFRRELRNPTSTARFGSNMETIEGRLAHWTGGDQLVGGNYNRIRDCAMRGNRGLMHFISFDELCASPGAVMKGIYEKIGEETFTHDFEAVEQTIVEDDSVHGLPGLHTIRSQVAPVRKDYREVLGEAWRAYAGFNYDFI